jgi:hypothetical protein
MVEKRDAKMYLIIKHNFETGETLEIRPKKVKWRANAEREVGRLNNELKRDGEYEEGRIAYFLK